jgi:acetyltransferase-like isoleucine patch superfamily enzyme
MKGAIGRALSKLHRRIHDLEDRAAYPKVGAHGPGSIIRMPSMFHHPERVFIGRDVTIHPYCRIEVITENPHIDGPPLPANDARIEIGDRVVINSFAHFGAMARIVLGNDVGIASGVCIEDHHYEYEGATEQRPLKKQPFRVAEVIVEDGVMIGEHATVLPGVRIGRNSSVSQMCTLEGTGAAPEKNAPVLGERVYLGSGSRVIGPVKVGDGAAICANSVVVDDVPEKGVVLGNPGVVISRRGSADFIYLGGETGVRDLPPEEGRAA